VARKTDARSFSAARSKKNAICGPMAALRLTDRPNISVDRYGRPRSGHCRKGVEPWLSRLPGGCSIRCKSDACGGYDQIEILGLRGGTKAERHVGNGLDADVRKIVETMSTSIAKTMLFFGREHTARGDSRPAVPWALRNSGNDRNRPGERRWARKDGDARVMNPVERSARRKKLSGRIAAAHRLRSGADFLPHEKRAPTASAQPRWHSAGPRGGGVALEPARNGERGKRPSAELSQNGRF